MGPLYFKVHNYWVDKMLDLNSRVVGSSPVGASNDWHSSSVDYNKIYQCGKCPPVCTHLETK